MTRDELAALDAAATKDFLADSGCYFAEGCDDLTQCDHSDTGYYRNGADGRLIAALWNLYRSGKLVMVPSVEEVAADIACNSPTGLQYPWHTEAARAVLTSMGAKRPHF